MLKAHQGKHQADQGKNQLKAATKQVRFHVQPGMISPVLGLTNLLSVLFSCHVGPHGERLEELPDRWNVQEMDVTMTEHHDIGFPCVFLGMAATMRHLQTTTTDSLGTAATMTCPCNRERRTL